MNVDNRTIKPACFLGQEAPLKTTRRALSALVMMVPLLSEPMFFARDARAEETEIELGWANLPPCTRVTNSGQSLFNIPDTLETTAQQITAYLHVEAPDVSSIEDSIRHCALDIALPAAGISAVIADPAAAQPAFFAAFKACMANESWDRMNLHVETKCEGW